VRLKGIGLGIIVIGVTSFFIGLFGIPRELSIPIAAAGILLLVIGVAILLFTLRGVRAKAPHVSLIALIALAIGLHAYENFVKSSGAFSLGFFLWSLTPYALCLVVAWFSVSSIPAVAGAVVALLFDLDAHNHVFVNPTSSTAGLALIFVPLWNTLVFAPLAMLAAMLLLRLRPRTDEIAP